MNSYAELIEVHCQICQRSFQGKVRLGIEDLEGLNLVKQINGANCIALSA